MVYQILKPLTKWSELSEVIALTLVCTAEVRSVATTGCQK